MLVRFSSRQKLGKDVAGLSRPASTGLYVEY